MSRLLSRPIPLCDGRLLRTLAQARELTKKNKRAGLRCQWSRADALLETAAGTGAQDDIDRATGKLEMVLLGEQKLDLTR